jgi:hypothetical protein
MMSQMKQHQSEGLYGNPIAEHETKQLHSCPLQISQHFKDCVPPILQLKESKCTKEAQSYNIFN